MFYKDSVPISTSRMLMKMLSPEIPKNSQRVQSQHECPVGAWEMRPGTLVLHGYTIRSGEAATKLIQGLELRM